MFLLCHTISETVIGLRLMIDEQQSHVMDTHGDYLKNIKWQTK